MPETDRIFADTGLHVPAAGQVPRTNPIGEALQESGRQLMYIAERQAEIKDSTDITHAVVGYEGKTAAIKAKALVNQDPAEWARANKEDTGYDEFLQPLSGRTRAIAAGELAKRRQAFQQSFAFDTIKLNQNYQQSTVKQNNDQITKLLPMVDDAASRQQLLAHAVAGIDSAVHGGAFTPEQGEAERKRVTHDAQFNTLDHIAANHPEQVDKLLSDPEFQELTSRDRDYIQRRADHAVTEPWRQMENTHKDDQAQRGNLLLGQIKQAGALTPELRHTADIWYKQGLIPDFLGRAIFGRGPQDTNEKSDPDVKRQLFDKIWHPGGPRIDRGDIWNNSSIVPQDWKGLNEEYDKALAFSNKPIQKHAAARWGALKADLYAKYPMAKAVPFGDDAVRIQQDLAHFKDQYLYAGSMGEVSRLESEIRKSEGLTPNFATSITNEPPPYAGGFDLSKESPTMRAIVNVESAGDPSAVSPKGAMGLGQIMPDTLTFYNHSTGHSMTPEDIKDPEKNIQVSKWYLEQLSKRFGGDLGKTLWAYNAGPENVDKNYMPEETRQYIERVTGLLNSKAMIGAWIEQFGTANIPPGLIQNYKTVYGTGK